MSIQESCRFIGNATSEAQMKYLPNGTAVSNFTLAVNSQYKTADGTLVKKVKWIRCNIWGKLAEAITEYITKGKQLAVEGELVADDSGNPRIFDRNDGSKGASFELRVSGIKLLGSASGSGNGKPAATETPTSTDTGADIEISPF